MKIELLADHPDVIPELARWYISQWGPYYGRNGPGDAHADLEARCNRETLPIGLVAIEDRRVLATAAVGCDASAHLTPSVIGMLVEQNHRGRGIGSALLKTCSDITRKLGYRHLYISTSVPGNSLIEMGWQEVGQTRFLNSETGSIYARDL